MVREQAVKPVSIVAPFDYRVNTASGISRNYLGQHKKLTETDLNLPSGIIQMGARVYIPTIVRFLSVDPVEGGTDNNYVYANDPVNEFDLDGRAIPLLIIAAHVARIAAPHIARTAVKYIAKPAAQFVAKKAVPYLAKKATPYLAKKATPYLAKKATVAAKKIVPQVRGGISRVQAFVRKASPFNGQEFVLRSGIRFKPFGHWTNKNLYAKLPHYHQKTIPKPNIKIQRISPKWHRPWETWRK